MHVQEVAAIFTVVIAAGLSLKQYHTRRNEMFKNTFQSGFLSILYSIGSKPLQIWDKNVRTEDEFV